MRIFVTALERLAAADGTRASRGESFAAALFAFLLSATILLLYLVEHNYGRDLWPAYPLSDAAVYLHNAWYMAFVERAGGDTGALLDFSPYTALLAFAFSITGSTYWTPFAVNGLLYALACSFVTAATSNMYGLRAALVVAVLFALCANIVYFFGVTVKTALPVFLTALALWALSLLEQGRCRWEVHLLAFLAFLAILVAALERHHLVAPAAVMLVSTCLHPVHAGSALKRLQPLLAFALALMVVALISTATADDTEATFYSPPGLNYYAGNQPDAEGGYTPVEGLGDTIVHHRTEAYQRAHDAGYVTAFAANLYWLERSMGYAQSEPGKFALLQLKKVRALASPYTFDSPENVLIAKARSTVMQLAIVDFGVVLAAALGAISIGRLRRDPFARTLLFSSAAFAAALVVFFVAERYRITLLVFLLPLAAATLDHLSRRPTAHPVAIATVLGAWIATWLAFASMPAGSGWSDAPNELVAREADERVRMRSVHDIMATYGRDTDAREYERLASHLARHGFAEDARRIAWDGAEQWPYRHEPYEALRALARRTHDCTLARDTVEWLREHRTTADAPTFGDRLILTQERLEQWLATCDSAD